jgi:hypothetical protein
MAFRTTSPATSRAEALNLTIEYHARATGSVLDLGNGQFAHYAHLRPQAPCA